MTKSNTAFHIANIPTDAPWRWLAQGWQDLWATPALSLAYGASFVAVGALITVGLWAIGLSSVTPVLASGFVLVGPILAMGLYEISRRREANEAITSWREVILVKTASRLQLAYLGFFIAFVLLLWVRIAQILYAIFTNGDYVPLHQFSSFVLGQPEGLALLAVGSVIGAVLALIIFAVSAISVPMLLERDVDIVTAVVASFQACLNNSAAMLLWAWLIAVLIGFGIATAFLGLIVVFPLVGHATWHAYRSLVSDSPSADVGDASASSSS